MEILQSCTKPSICIASQEFIFNSLHAELYIKIIKYVFTFLIIPRILFNRRRPNSRWSNPTCCLLYTVTCWSPGDLNHLNKPEHSVSSIRKVKKEYVCSTTGPKFVQVTKRLYGFTRPYWVKLDMSTARRRLKSPRSLSGTPAHLTMVTQVNIMVMNRWLTSFSFIVNRPPHSWDKAISDSDLETPRSRSWVWSKGKVIQLAQYHINSFSFSHQSDQQFRK